MTLEEYAQQATWYVRLEGFIVAEVLSNYSPDDENPPIPDGNEYVAIDFSDGIQIGWGYDGANFYPIARTEMTIAEWTATFTPIEWEQSENAAYVPGFVLDGAVVTDAVRQEWRQYLDVIKSNIPGPGQGQRAVNVLQPPVDNYYTFLVAQNFITEARKAELQAGIA
jgi:hypothetical protein